MLQYIGPITIDTDYPEYYIDEVTSLLPFPLNITVAEKLRELNEVKEANEKLADELADSESRIDLIHDERDGIANYIDTAIAEVSDADFISYLKNIKRDLEVL